MFGTDEPHSLAAMPAVSAEAAARNGFAIIWPSVGASGVTGDLMLNNPMKDASRAHSLVASPRVRAGHHLLKLGIAQGRSQQEKSRAKGCSDVRTVAGA